jgi:hypothetical protein
MFRLRVDPSVSRIGLTLPLDPDWSIRRELSCTRTSRCPQVFTAWSLIKYRDTLPLRTLQKRWIKIHIFFKRMFIILTFRKYIVKICNFYTDSFSLGWILNQYSQMQYYSVEYKSVAWLSTVGISRHRRGIQTSKERIWKNVWRSVVLVVA